VNEDRPGVPGRAGAPPLLSKPPKERFSAAADLYGRYRPSYPLALRDFLRDLLPASGTPPTIADIGCGTGISTRLVAGAGARVIGIDPNQEMLAEAVRTTPAGLEIEYQVGEATATGLPAHSVALITVAQAFHWFDIPATLAEFARVLIPGGRCAAYWNLRDPGDSPFLAEYDALLTRYSQEYATVPRGEETLERIAAAPGVRALQRAEFPYQHPLDRQGFFGRVRSSSYVTHGVPPAEQAAFDAALERLFEQYAREGIVTFAYRTRVLAFEVPAASGAERS
jgi:SAM-dependent methyltransferase